MTYDAFDTTKRHAGVRVDSNMKRTLVRIIRNCERQAKQPSSNAEVANSYRVLAHDLGTYPATIVRAVERLISANLLRCIATENRIGGAGVNKYIPISREIVFDDDAISQVKDPDVLARRVAWFAECEADRAKARADTPEGVIVSTTGGVIVSTTGAVIVPTQGPLLSQGSSRRQRSNTSMQRASADKSTVDESKAIETKDLDNNSRAHERNAHACEVAKDDLETPIEREASSESTPDQEHYAARVAAESLPRKATSKENTP